MANQSFGILGRKLGMTQIYDAAGAALGVTVVQVGPNTVIRVKTADSKDGYTSVQFGFGSQKPQRRTKAQLGHLTKHGVEGVPRVIREVRITAEAASKLTAGETIGASTFTAGELVDVTGVSKGRGFAGVMKRHNMAGFKRSHGVHEYHRHGGSIGTRLTPGMTLKGVKMPGHMGNAKTTIQNLKVVKVDTERNLVFLRGGVPGPDGAHVVVRKAVKH